MARSAVQIAMRIETAARKFAGTEAEYSGWIAHLRDMANAYDAFLSERLIILSVQPDRSRRLKK